MFNKIVIFGVGLIGGSFAKALREAGAVKQIVGVGRSHASLERAQQLGLIDTIGDSLEDAVRDADLILLAAPVAQTETILSSIQPFLSSQTVITDAGSIKGEVIAAAERALGDRIVQFVPGHPIAGRETTGPEAAIADLYVGRKVVLTPLAQNKQSDVARVTQAWETCGAHVHVLTAAEHDAVFAAVSHLPHLLAFALVDAFASQSNADLLFRYAASGFRDFTRIAASSPEMWRDIALANREAVIDELDKYMAQLTAMRAHLQAGDGGALQATFANAQRARRAWQHNIETAEAQPIPNRDE